MSKYIKYVLWATLISWFLFGCGMGLDTAPTASLVPASEALPTHTQSNVTMTSTKIPLSGVAIVTPALLPDTGWIIPTVEYAPDPSYTFAGHLRWFFEEQTILTKMNGITLIHPATGATMKLEGNPAARFPNSINTSPLSPNGKWIAYAVGSQELILLNTSTTDKKIYIFPSGIGSLVWMPDNRHLLLNIDASELGDFGALESSPILLFYFDIETGAYTILSDGSVVQVLDVLPDGESFLYYDHLSRIDLMLGFVSGDQPIQLTDDTLYKFWVDLTPDGKWLAVFATNMLSPADPPILTPDYCSWSPYKAIREAYLVNIETRERRNYPIVGKIAYVRLSPDGSKIAYIKAEGTECLGNFPVHILDVESSVEERLDVGGFDLAWSPDGSKLVFTQFSPEFQYRKRLVIYDLSSRQITATYYIEDLIWVAEEGTTPSWVNLNRLDQP